jgi:hypothetical protein
MRKIANRCKLKRMRAVRRQAAYALDAPGMLLPFCVGESRQTVGIAQGLDTDCPRRWGMDCGGVVDKKGRLLQIKAVPNTNYTALTTQEPPTRCKQISDVCLSKHSAGPLEEGVRGPSLLMKAHYVCYLCAARRVPWRSPQRCLVYRNFVLCAQTCLTNRLFSGNKRIQVT